MKCFHQQRGMTLIEIMISLLIGVFLIGGILQIFLSTQQTYRTQENLSRMQENGRFAMEFLTRDIRMAGYQGCASNQANNMVDVKNPNPNPNPITLSVPITAVTGNDGVADNWNAIACSGSDKCIAGTDSISFHFGVNCGNLTGVTAPNNANIKIDAVDNNNICTLSQYDVLLVSDCDSADIFVATAVSSNSGDLTITHAANQDGLTAPKLSKLYGHDASLFKLKSSTFFIRSGVSGQPALWKMDNTKDASGTNPVELIEGVENMQILYGEDTDADNAPNYYVPEGTAGLTMDNVVSIRISILVRSTEDNLTSEPRAYTYNGATTTPGDNRLRRVFTSTIAIRNRLP